MDERIRMLNSSHAQAANILCRSGTLERALQLRDNDGLHYYPLQLGPMPNGTIYAVNLWHLYLASDPEYDPFHYAMECEANPFGGNQQNPQLPLHHFLNLPNTAEDVRFRQEGVKELVDNRALYEAVTGLLTQPRLYKELHFNEWPHKNFKLACNLTPESVSYFVDAVEALQEHRPRSGPFQRLAEWTEYVRKDTLLSELMRSKRKVTDSRIFAVYSERFGEMRYGLLKTGVKPEQVFDFLSKNMSGYERQWKDRRGRVKKESRDVVKYETDDDKAFVTDTVGHARQRMDIINELSVQSMAIPVVLMQLQLKHLLQGACFHQLLGRNGYSAVFPEIDDNQSTLLLRDVLPVRLVLEHICRPQDRYTLMANTFDFSGVNLIQAEGPNRRGKSEGWRTVHFATPLTNAGYSVPAREAVMGIAPASHFISWKGKEGHGGSELERVLQHVQHRLKSVNPGDRVILDELGDATNAHTAKEIARRLIPALLARGCKVFLTTHHDALADYVRDAGGLSLTPSTSEAEKYVLVPAEGQIDFKASDTLADLGFTRESIDSIVSSWPRPSIARPNPPIEQDPLTADGRRVDDDVPF